MLDELIPHHLDQERPSVPQLGQTIDHIHHQMEPVNVILHPHIKGSCNGAFLLVAPDVELTVGTAIGQLMNQRRVTMERKDNGLILGKQRIIIRIAESMGMLAGGLSFIKSTTLMTRTLISGIYSRRIVTAASVSSVGVSPQQAITTSGSCPASLLAHGQMPMP